jgi:SAM-dependent methyltransferase
VEDVDGRDTRDRNRAVWRAVNEAHTDAAADRAWSQPDIRWGLFGVREAELQVLGDVAGLDVVELAAGTAYVSAWLTRRGARCVALDLSEDQLRTAARCQSRYGPRFPLLQADAEQLPLRDGCADLVVSEHGAAAWCDPERWVPEAARLLRPGGRLVFLTNSHLSAMTVPDDPGPAGEVLLRGQRETYRVSWDGGGVEHHPSHGDWIRILTGAGLIVQALHELYAPVTARDHDWYDIATASWAAQWPAEELWVAQKRIAAPSAP